MLVRVFLTVLVATWLLGSCAGDASDASDARPGLGCAGAPELVSKPAPISPKVRVGVTGSLFEAAQYLADAEGYFAAQGLTVQLINFTSTSRMAPALAAGQLEVGSGNIGPALLSGAQSNPCVKIVGPLARQDANASGVYLFLRRELADNGSIRSYADLKGLHVGVPARDSTSEYALAKALGAGGLSIKDVRVAQMGYAALLVSLANRSIDVAVLPESVATTATDKNLGVKWKSVADVAPGAQFGVLLFSHHFANQKDTAVRWMSAYLQGARDYDGAFFRNVRRGEVVDQLTKVSPMKDARLYDEMGFPVLDPNGVVNLDSVADQVKWWLQTGDLREDVDVSRVVDTSYAEAAVERLGPY